MELRSGYVYLRWLDPSGTVPLLQYPHKSIIDVCITLHTLKNNRTFKGSSAVFVLYTVNGSLLRGC